MFDTNLNGVASEMLVVSNLSKNKYEVYTPVALGGKIDLLAIKDNKIIKIHVKKGTVNNRKDRICADLRRSSSIKGDRHYDFDDDTIIAIVYLEENKVAYIKFNKAETTVKMTFWLKQPATTKGFRKDYKPIMFEDYIDKITL